MWITLSPTISSNGRSSKSIRGPPRPRTWCSSPHYILPDSFKLCTSTSYSDLSPASSIFMHHGSYKIQTFTMPARQQKCYHERTASWIRASLLRTTSYRSTRCHRLSSHLKTTNHKSTSRHRLPFSNLIYASKGKWKRGGEKPSISIPFRYL